MKKLIIMLLAVIASSNAFGQISFNRSTKEVVASTMFCNVTKIDSKYYLDIEFWQDNGKSKDTWKSVGRKYLFIGNSMDEVTKSMDILLGLMDSKTTDDMTISTYDGIEMEVCASCLESKGLFFTFRNEFEAFPKVAYLYKIHLAPLAKKVSLLN